MPISTEFSPDNKSVFTEEQIEFLDQTIHKSRWRAIGIWIVIFTITVFVLLALARHQSHENGKRITESRILIAEIQQSRTSSCRRTYSKIAQLLKASTQGRNLDSTQRKKFDKLLKIIDPDQCANQTKPGKAARTGK